MDPQNFVPSQDYRQQENTSFIQKAMDAVQEKKYPQALHHLKLCHPNIMSPTVREQYDNLERRASIEQNHDLMRQAATQTHNNMPFEALSLLEHCNLEVMLPATRHIYDEHKHRILELVNNELIGQALRDINNTGQYDRALSTLARCTPEAMDNEAHYAFYMLQARCFLHLNQYQKALNALQQLHDTPSENITRMFLTCYRALGDVENIVKTLTRVKNWHENSQISSELHQRASYFKNQKDYLSAANILTQFPNWTSNESTLMQVAELYSEAAKLLPETSVKRMELLQLALNTYMQVSNFKTRQDTLLKLAPLHFLMRDYVNVLSAYYALSTVENNEQTIKNIQPRIQILESYFFALKMTTSPMQQEHFTVLNYALELKKAGYISQALDFYQAVSDNFKPMEARRDQASCQEILGRYQASVVPSSTFTHTPSSSGTNTSHRPNAHENDQLPRQHLS
jgi:tetratricopeptide (TPR) repeat protein